MCCSWGKLICFPPTLGERENSAKKFFMLLDSRKIPLLVCRFCSSATNLALVREHCIIHPLTKEHTSRYLGRNIHLYRQFLPGGIEKAVWFDVRSELRTTEQIGNWKGKEPRVGRGLGFSAESHGSFANVNPIVPCSLRDAQVLQGACGRIR